MDEELLPLVDGTPASGPGGCTSQSIGELRRRRVEQGHPLGERPSTKLMKPVKTGVLPFHALNGGAQNHSHAILSGALVRAQVGLSGIPQLHPFRHGARSHLLAETGEEPPCKEWMVRHLEGRPRIHPWSCGSSTQAFACQSAPKRIPAWSLSLLS